MLHLRLDGCIQEETIGRTRGTIFILCLFGPRRIIRDDCQRNNQRQHGRRRIPTGERHRGDVVLDILRTAHGLPCPDGTHVGVHIGIVPILFIARTAILSGVRVGGIMDERIHDVPRSRRIE